MKLHIVRTANRRISNIEPQNVEGWNRCALSFEIIKIDRIPSFDIRHSTFDIRCSTFDVRRSSLETTPYGKFRLDDKIQNG